MCLGMNPDILQPGERCASTSNRNFEGRQGRGGRTHLVSPQMAAAAAIAGPLRRHPGLGRERCGARLSARVPPGSRQDVADGFIDDRRKLIPLFDVQEELAAAADHARRAPRSRRFSTSARATAASRSWCWRRIPESTGVLVDFSEPMLAAAEQRLAGTGAAAGRSCAATSRHRRGATALPAGERYDAVVSRLASTTFRRAQARALRGGVRPAGAGRHVPQLGARRRPAASPKGMFDEFFLRAAARGRAGARAPAPAGGGRARTYDDAADDDILRDPETQCGWLREIGFEHVDVYFKLPELAIFGGVKAGGD